MTGRSGWFLTHLENGIFLESAPRKRFGFMLAIRFGAWSYQFLLFYGLRIRSAELVLEQVK